MSDESPKLLVFREDNDARETLQAILDDHADNLRCFILSAVTKDGRTLIGGSSSHSRDQAYMTAALQAHMTKFFLQD